MDLQIKIKQSKIWTTEFTNIGALVEAISEKYC